MTASSDFHAHGMCKFDASIYTAHWSLLATGQVVNLVPLSWRYVTNLSCVAALCHSLGLLSSRSFSFSFLDSGGDHASAGPVKLVSFAYTTRQLGVVDRVVDATFDTIQKRRLGLHRNGGVGTLRW